MCLQRRKKKPIKLIFAKCEWLIKKIITKKLTKTLNHWIPVHHAPLVMDGSTNSPPLIPTFDKLLFLSVGSAYAAFELLTSDPRGSRYTDASLTAPISAYDVLTPEDAKKMLARSVAYTVIEDGNNLDFSFFLFIFLLFKRSFSRCKGIRAILDEPSWCLHTVSFFW